jgi:hypothetical protein
MWVLVYHHLWNISRGSKYRIELSMKVAGGLLRAEIYTKKQNDGEQQGP